MIGIIYHSNSQQPRRILKKIQKQKTKAEQSEARNNKQPTRPVSPSARDIRKGKNGTSSPGRLGGRNKMAASEQRCLWQRHWA